MWYINRLRNSINNFFYSPEIPFRRRVNETKIVGREIVKEAPAIGKTGDR